MEEHIQVIDDWKNWEAPKKKKKKEQLSFVEHSWEYNLDLLLRKKTVGNEVECD